MKRKFFKQSVTFLLTLVIAFSNLPYDSLVQAISLYRHNRNIVDRFWKAEHDANIVDNFARLPQWVEKSKIHEAYAAAGDGRINYGTGTNAIPQTRAYTNSTNTFSAAGNTIAGTANVGWTVSKESPTEDVTVLATQSTTGVLDVFCRNSAGAWSKDFTTTIGANAATRRFDVEFEKTSGIPMVVYSKNVATTNEIGFRRKTGAGCGAAQWAAETLVNPTRITGTVLWMELEARRTAGTNVMAMAFSDSSATQGGILESMIWDGTTWGNESPAGAAQGWSDLSIELQGTAGANAAKVFDLAFETNSGDLIIGWGTSIGANGTNGFRYATCAAALPCTWSAALTPTGPLDDATMVAAAADPDPASNGVAFISIGNAGSDLQGWFWNGTAVGATAPNADTGAAAPGAGKTLVDIDWVVVTGTNRMAVGVYADSASPVKYIYYDSVGLAWRTNGSAGFSVTGAPATVPNQIQTTTNPNNTTQLMLNFSDTASDLWAKRLTYNGANGGATTALSTWSNSDGGVALDLSVSAIASKAFNFDWVKVTLATGPDATSYTNSTEAGLNFSVCATTGCGGRIGQTIVLTGTGFGTVSAGSRANCAGGAGTGCVRLANFTVPDASVTAWTDTSITFTVPATTSVFGGSGATCNGADGNGLCVTAAGVNDTAGGSLQFFVFPDITSISPSGAGEAREGDVITITGTRFNTVAGTVDFLNCGTVAGTVGVWGDTSITVTVPGGIPDNDDLCDVRVTRAAGTGSKTDTSLNFIVLPDVTSMAVCTTCNANSSREFDGAGDTDGLIMLQGNHLGTAAGTVTFTGAITFAIHATVEGSCTVGGWAAAGTSVCVEVNSTIADTVNTGTITPTRTGDSKTDVITLTSVLPEITSNTAASGVIGDKIKITGKHFCQAGCPVSPPTAGDTVVFGTTAALASDFVALGGAPCSVLTQSWNAGEICVKVPAGTPSGSQPTKVTSGTSFVSNTSAFTVVSSVPNDPDVGPGASKGQFKSDGTTAISIGAGTNETTAIFKILMSAGVNATLEPQVEVKAVATAFDGTGVVVGTGVSYTGTPVTGSVTVSTLADGTSYHWRARVRNTGTNEFSNWAAFGGNPAGTGATDGSPANTDLFVDVSAPVISGICVVNPSATSCDTSLPSDIQAQIRWSTNEGADEQVAYGTTCPTGQASAAATFAALASKQPASPSGSGTTHTQTLSGLIGGTTYQYMIRSTDAVGNVAYNPSTANTCNSFVTAASVTRIMKTNEFFIQTATSTSLTDAYPTSFSIFIPESNITKSNISFKSIIIEISGTTLGTGGAGIAISPNVNSAGAVSHTLADPGSGTAVSWKLSLPASSLNFDCPGCTPLAPNTLDVGITGGGVSTLVSAKAIITYFYTP